MNYLSRNSRLIVFIMMLSVMTGCALLGGGKVPKTKLVASTAEVQTKPTIYFRIDDPQRKSQELLGELEKSQYFKKIMIGSSDEANIELDVRLSYIPSPNFNEEFPITMISFLSAGHIPVWGTDDYKVIARVKNKIGLKKEYELNDSVTLIIWNPLILFTPFTYDKSEKVRRNMYRNIIQQMYEDGFMGES